MNEDELKEEHGHFESKSVTTKQTMEERFDEKYKEITKNSQTVQGTGGLIYLAIPTKRVLELKDFITAELQSLALAILEKKTIGDFLTPAKIWDKGEIISVSDIISVLEDRGIELPK